MFKSLAGLLAAGSNLGPGSEDAITSSGGDSRAAGRPGQRGEHSALFPYLKHPLGGGDWRVGRAVGVGRWGRWGPQLSVGRMVIRSLSATEQSPHPLGASTVALSRTHVHVWRGRRDLGHPACRGR